MGRTFKDDKYKRPFKDKRDKKSWKKNKNFDRPDDKKIGGEDNGYSQSDNSLDSERNDIEE